MPATPTDRLYGLTTSVAVKPPVQISADYNVITFGDQEITSSTFTGTRTVTTTKGVRVLLTGQTNPIDNGIWEAMPATWRRAPDFDGARDCVNGTLVFSIYGDCWQVEATDPVRIGYDPINFRSTYPFSGDANLFQRSLRVPEPFVNELPPESGRAGHLLAFNNEGQPVMVLPESGSAADVLLDLASTSDGEGDAMIGVKQPFTGAVARTQHDKNADTVNARDFGLIADGTYHPLSEKFATLSDAKILYPFIKSLDQSIDYAACQAAINYLTDTGGGTVIGSEGHYVLSQPFSLLSNVWFEGEGYGTFLDNALLPGVNFPGTNCVHIGYSNEWGKFGGADSSVSDAKLSELLANNFSNITTKNAGIRNVRVGSKGLGLGVWALNAMNVVIEDIWSDNTTTPVNVANDNPACEAGCFNVAVDRVYQVAGNLGEWHDLFFAGSAVNVSVNALFNNPNSPSKLAEMVVFNGTVNFSLTNSHFVSTNTLTPSGKSAVKIASSAVTNIVSGKVSGCSFRRVVNAIDFSCAGIVATGNTFTNSYSPIQLNAPYNKISGNIFDGNYYDVAGSVNGYSNTISDNKGIKNIVRAGTTTPELYNNFFNNDSLYNLGDNQNIYAALRMRKIMQFPYDAWISDADKSKIATLGAIVALSNPGNVTLYYKLPAFVKKISSIAAKGFAGGTGANDTIRIVISGLDGELNTNTMSDIVDLGTKTSASAGDFSFNFSESPYLHAAGTYYLKVIYTAANNGSQLRNMLVTCLCDN